ncbi:MAG: hypothetical protein EA394_04070 [Bacteroidia bacterium]|nr:MAG: hypothetical protein EA394_04070 [Bacteroidia bacterium]
MRKSTKQEITCKLLHFGESEYIFLLNPYRGSPVTGAHSVFPGFHPGLLLFDPFGVGGWAIGFGMLMGICN